MTLIYHQLYWISTMKKDYSHWKLREQVIIFNCWELYFQLKFEPSNPSSEVDSGHCVSGGNVAAWLILVKFRPSVDAILSIGDTFQICIQNRLDKVQGHHQCLWICKHLWPGCLKTKTKGSPSATRKLYFTIWENFKARVTLEKLIKTQPNPLPKTQSTAAARRQASARFDE